MSTLDTRAVSALERIADSLERLVETVDYERRELGPFRTPITDAAIAAVDVDEQRWRLERRIDSLIDRWVSGDISFSEFRRNYNEASRAKNALPPL